MTECNQSNFEFQTQFSRGVVARFDGGTMTSDAGALLLWQTDQRLKLLSRLAACFEDHRKVNYISHSLTELVSQRAYRLAQGYEDLSDHDQLRQDPLLALLSGKPEPDKQPLAGKSTLNRMKLSVEQPSRYKKIHYRREQMDEMLVTICLEAYPTPPERIVIDLDATD